MGMRTIRILLFLYVENTFLVVQLSSNKDFSKRSTFCKNSDSDSALQISSVSASTSQNCRVFMSQEDLEEILWDKMVRSDFRYRLINPNQNQI